MKKLISVVIPALNEKDNVSRACERVKAIFETGLSSYDYEIIFTDNRSDDGTFEILKSIAKDNSNIRVVRFSKNVGYQRSILTGYLIAKGDAIVQLDCDLQDPPELIPKMISLWENGNNVVYGVRATRKEGILITAFRALFYRILNALSQDNLPLNAGDFRLIDRKVLAALKRMKAKSPYLRGQIASAGFKQIGFEYDRAAREFGETKFNLAHLIRLSTDALLAHSVVPLRLAAYFGFFMTILAGLLIVGYGVASIQQKEWPAGFTTLAILSLLNIGVVSLFLGIIGEYIIKVMEQVSVGPISIIDESINVSEESLKDTPQILYVADT